MYGFDHKAPLMLRKILERLLNLGPALKEGKSLLCFALRPHTVVLCSTLGGVLGLRGMSDSLGYHFAYKVPFASGAPCSKQLRLGS